MTLSRCKAAIRHEMRWNGLTSVREGIWAWFDKCAGPDNPLPTLIGRKGKHDRVRAADIRRRRG